MHHSARRHPEHDDTGVHQPTEADFPDASRAFFLSIPASLPPRGCVRVPHPLRHLRHLETQCTDVAHTQVRHYEETHYDDDLFVGLAGTGEEE